MLFCIIFYYTLYINLGIYNYNWNDNVFEIYENDNVCERTPTETITAVNTITEHSDDSYMSTAGTLLF